jgi:purine-nucleoside phosphorylase
MQNPEEVQRAAEHLAGNLPRHFRPRFGLICGTGLDGIAREFEIARSVPFGDIPGFPRATALSHAGCFSAAFLGDLPVLLQRGRYHLYEGRSPAQICAGVRVMRVLGAETLFVTNTAGCLNPQWEAGDLMLISDHINCTGASPLTGTNHEPWGARFPDMSRIYDGELMRLALATASELGMRLERGVYAGVPGPELESPAQTRFYRAAGADAVGMSTVLEVIAARHMGMRVLALACLSNKNLPDCMDETDIGEIIAVAERASGGMIRLLAAVMRKMRV